MYLDILHCNHKYDDVGIFLLRTAACMFSFKHCIYCYPFGSSAESFAQDMAPRWHQGTTAPRAIKKNKKLGKCPKVNLRFKDVLMA